MVFVIPYSEAASCYIHSLSMTSPTWPMEEDKDNGISTSAQWSYSGSSCPSRFSAKWQYRDPGSGTWDDMGIFANISMNIPRVLCSPFTSTCFVSGTFYGKAYGDLYDIRVAANCVGCGERYAAYYDVLNITDLTAPVIIVDSTESGTTFYNGVAELPIACNDGLNNPDALGIYGNWTGSWDLNVSIQPFIDSMTYQVNTSGVAEGIYTYAAWCNDTYGNSRIGSNKTLIFIDDFGCDYPGTGDWTIDADTHCFQENKNIVLEAGKGIYVLGNLTLINTNVSGFSFINFTKILPSYPVVRFNMTKKSSLNFTSI